MPPVGWLMRTFVTVARRQERLAEQVVPIAAAPLPATVGVLAMAESWPMAGAWLAAGLAASTLGGAWAAEQWPALRKETIPAMRNQMIAHYAAWRIAKTGAQWHKNAQARRKTP